MSDLEEAILIHRVSLSLHPTPHPRRSVSLNNLANALFYRFLQTGLMTDLQEVVLLYRESLSLRPTSHPSHADSLYNVANSLQKLFGMTGSMTDLEETILYCIVNHYPSVRPLIQIVLNHSTALHVRFGIVLERQAQRLTLKKQFQWFVNRYPSGLPQPIHNA